ncbi:MAG: sodium/proline symporter [Mariprofundaceae bacterium]|nr:sodium/proline symporter [Mariprofundaceae bacterium]
MDSITASFLVYTLIVFGFGVYAARFARHSSNDFFLAGRRLGPWLAGLSMSASAESGWVTLGLVGMAFHTGIGAFWILPGTVAAIAFNWWVLGRRLRSVAAGQGAVTLPDVLAGPFSGCAARLIRTVAVLIILSMLTAYVAAQLTAAAKTFEATFGWSYLAGIAMGAAIVLIYTSLGGFRAVAWTDVLQAMLMILAVTLLPWTLVGELGGMDAVLSRLAVQDAALTDPLAARAGLALFGFFMLWLGIPFGYSGQPHVLVRYMAARDERAILRGAVISNIWVFVLFSGAVLLGIAARAYYGELADAEKALPIAAAGLLPGWLAGMMIAAVMAAVCSTADSQLLVAASAVSHDLLRGVFGREVRERSLLAVHRAMVLLIGLTAAAIAAAESRVIFHFVLYAWAGLGAAFGPALILLLFWRRTNAAGVLAGMVTGVLTAVIWVETPVLKSLCYEMIPAFITAFVAVAVVSLASSRRA